MSSQSATIVQRLWNCCNVLCDDGVSYGDYAEQLTYLLFPRMDDEQAREPGKESTIPTGDAQLSQESGHAIIAPWIPGA